MTGISVELVGDAGESVKLVGNEGLSVGVLLAV
jgi:hypothetical protein